jgi:hypothetical protein
MNTVDIERLKSGEVNLGVSFAVVGKQGLTVVVDVDYGGPVRQGRSYWCRQSYNHWKLHRMTYRSLSPYVVLTIRLGQPCH